MAITAPSAPVTYTTLDGGTFANHLASITVQADAQGRTSVPFSPSPNGAGDVNLIAGSPLASGQVSFVVSVIPNVSAGK